MPVSRSLSIQRIAVTTPPAHWFHGISRSLADILQRALVDLGLSVFPVPVDAFLPPDAARTGPLLDDLRAFRPELALGLSAGNYALICRMPARRDGWRPNVFMDVLDIPLVCLWEHAPLEIADQVLAPLPEDPLDSLPGADHKLRRVLCHERLVHWSRDSGQTRLMTDLGYAAPASVIQTSAVLALPITAPPAAPATDDGSVAFIGHVYQGLPSYSVEELNLLAAGVIDAWMRDPRVPLWNVMMDGIAALAPALRQRLALDRDQTFFWRFAHRLIALQAQTALRLRMLAAVPVPVICYGNLDARLAGLPATVRPVADRVRYGAELAAVLACHAIVIDVNNPGNIDGFSEKGILAFTAGGFALVDRKRDWIDAFGSLGEEVSYTDADDLAAKVDLFLSRPAYRREIARAMRAEIQDRYRLDRILSDVLATAADKQLGAAARRMSAGVRETPAEVVMPLLGDIVSHPLWDGASVEHSETGALVTTPTAMWQYAAEIPVPPTLPPLREPHLRIRVRVETGRLGFAVLRPATGELSGEQFVSATTEAIRLTMELPLEDSIVVIVRNAADGQSRGLLTEALLCDRPR